MNLLYCFFFFNDTATTEIYTLSLHDALPISVDDLCRGCRAGAATQPVLVDVVVLEVEAQARNGRVSGRRVGAERSEEHTSELQSPCNLVCRLLLEKKNNRVNTKSTTQWMQTM